MTSLFDEAMALERASDGRFRATLGGEWTIAGVPNGGLIMGLAVEAAVRESAAVEPLTATTHFLSASAPGPMEITLERIKEGRRLSTFGVSTSQDGRERTRTLVTVGDRAASSGPSRVAIEAPDTSGWVPRSRAEPHFVEIAQQFEYRNSPSIAWDDPSEDAEPVVEGQIRFADETPLDHRSIPLLVDAFPPTTFQLGWVGWSPTLELTVHYRGRPTGTWATASIRANAIIDGMFEEDALLWDESGTLIAMSRQLALTPA